MVVLHNWSFFPSLGSLTIEYTNLTSKHTTVDSGSFDESKEGKCPFSKMKLHVYRTLNWEYNMLVMKHQNYRATFASLWEPPSCR
jgi:hypothetical protein